jgi:hypothetical protein
VNAKEAAGKTSPDFGVKIDKAGIRRLLGQAALSRAGAGVVPI